jgi:hypothetical protein
MKKTFKDLKVGDTIYIVDTLPVNYIARDLVSDIEEYEEGHIKFRHNQYDIFEYVKSENSSYRNFFVNEEDALEQLEKNISDKINKYKKEITLLKKELSTEKRKLSKTLRKQK